MMALTACAQPDEADYPRLLPLSELNQPPAIPAHAADAAAGSLQRVRIASAGTTRDDVVAPWLAEWSPEAPLASVLEAPVDSLYPALRRGVRLATGDGDWRVGVEAPAGGRGRLGRSRPPCPHARGGL